MVRWIGRHLLALALGTLAGAVLYLLVIFAASVGWAWGFLAAFVVPLLWIPVLLREVWLNERVRPDPRPSFHLTSAALGLAVPLFVLFLQIAD